MKIFKSDILIVGAGIAGLTAALECSKNGSVILITKGKTEETATEKAQGGIAAALDTVNDSVQYHLEDTIFAGAGLCDIEAVKVLVEDGVKCVKELIEIGVDFDKTSAGGFELNIEGAHRKRRILHAGDYTGKEIARALAAQVIKNPNIKILNYVFGKDLIIDQGKCVGVVSLDIKTNEKILFLAKATIISTGGVCQVYKYTTNPEFATGDGIAMAYRAGAIVRDMEFVQFHPTALVQFKGLDEEIAFPQFLISEAVRGEGGVLLNKYGQRFMEKYHKQAELAPRDIVARAIYQEMKETNSDHVHLNLSNINPEKVKKRFPTIYKTCQEIGLDLTTDNIPVAPAAHYFMGGIKTDLFGRTNILGLWAAGESMSSGVHGANRLASNSLLEGLVFGKRAALNAINYVKESNYAKLNNSYDESKFFSDNKQKLTNDEIKNFKQTLKTIMWENVGIIRNGQELNNAIEQLTEISKKISENPSTFEESELSNMLTISILITKAALDRKESRGAHYRTDYPKTDDKNWKRHLEYKNF